MDVIVCTAEGFAEMRDSLKAGKKISAIKALRRTAVPPPGYKTLGLREAKGAVERFAFEVLGDKTQSFNSDAMQITYGPVIKEMVVDFGDGPITMDLDAMEIRVLTQLNTVGLEACGKMLELCNVIKAFSEGKRVGVIDEEG
jgi:hypothetical protein